MRSFTIESIKRGSGENVKYTGGRFVSQTPIGAAKKAFTKAYHHLNANGSMSLKIKIRETTQDSMHKTYEYSVKRKAEKTVVERDGEMITYNFTTKIRAI